MQKPKCERCPYFSPTRGGDPCPYLFNKGFCRLKEENRDDLPRTTKNYIKWLKNQIKPEHQKKGKLILEGTV